MRYRDQDNEIQEIPSNNKKLVLLLGAGATYADRASFKKMENRPLLDKDFFMNTVVAHKFDDDITFKASSYMREIYDVDLSKRENDSFEKVLATLYTDMFNKNLERKALKTFQDLVSLFNSRLAETTNNIRITKNLYLYQIFDYYLRNGFDPDNITIISFNYDIHIEKILNVLAKSKTWKMNENICNFPACYKMKITQDKILIPPDPDSRLFDIKLRNKGIKILKLHGSINWYSKHKTNRPSPRVMFSPDRNILIIPDFNIPKEVKITRPSGRFGDYFGLPIIIPPVFHKSAILHNSIKRVWGLADQAIAQADEILIFGYSCPVTDVESSNLLKRGFKRNEKNVNISIMDPDSNAVKRYLDLLSLKKICYYQNAQKFLEDVKKVA